MKNLISTSSRALRMGLLAVTICFYILNGNTLFAQGRNSSDKTGIETEKLKLPMPACLDEGTLTSTFCDGGCATTGVPSAGGVFMCLSTDLSGLNLDPNHRNCDGTGSCDAGNCQYLHIRNLTEPSMIFF